MSKGVTAVANDLEVRLPSHGSVDDTDIAVALSQAMTSTIRSHWDLFSPRSRRAGSPWKAPWLGTTSASWPHALPATHVE